MSHFDDLRVEFMLQIASYSMGMDSVDHPSQVEKYSCHAKHQGKYDKGDHHSDQCADDLLEKFYGTKIRGELYINMKAVLNF